MGVLLQKDKVIAYAPRQRKTHGINYTTYDLRVESCGICIENLETLIVGTRCKVFTDHKSLQLIQMPCSLNR